MGLPPRTIQWKRRSNRIQKLAISIVSTQSTWVFLQGPFNGNDGRTEFKNLRYQLYQRRVHGSSSKDHSMETTVEQNSKTCDINCINAEYMGLPPRTIQWKRRSNRIQKLAISI